MEIKVTRGLSYQMLKRAAIRAFFIGLLISTVQISIDYRQTKKLPDADMQALIGMIKDPLTAIVYNLDPDTASELLNGTLKHPAVISTRIVLPDGHVFVEQSKPLPYRRFRLLNDIFFGETKSYLISLQSRLNEKSENIGQVEITIDTYHYGKLFLEHAGITLIGIVIYSLSLSALLLYLFYRVVTRPLSGMIRSIANINVESPGKTRLYEPKNQENSEIGLLARLTNQHLQTIDLNIYRLRAAERILKHHTDQLELIVAKRTEELSETIEQLKAAQSQLIESEKLAALGGLVAGVAHEVNTPLGISVTAASVMAEVLNDIKDRFDKKSLTSEVFEERLGVALESISILNSNIARASKLVRDFKQTAVDQESEVCCRFSVKSSLDALLASLNSETRKLAVAVSLSCDENIVMESYPGAVTQLMANLVINSVRHAFVGVAQPAIDIIVSDHGDQVFIEYRDNGVGVPDELHEKIFEPFYTTKRGHGGSGLGLNIVYNIAVGKLGGKLEFSSSPNQGVHFLLCFPKRHSKYATVT